MRVISKGVLAGVVLFTVSLIKGAESTANTWPLKLTGEKGVATVYQPQLEGYKDNRITGRAAVSFLYKGETVPIFGAVWLVGRVLTDREAETVTVTSVEVTDVKAPSESPDGFQALKTFLSEQLTSKLFVIPLAQLTALVEEQGQGNKGVPALSTTPPEILFRDRPAVLIIMDGDPKTQPLSDGKILQVVNTAEILIQDPASSFYYLWTDSGWIGAAALTGPWSRPATVPPAVDEFGKKIAANEPPADPKKTKSKKGKDVVPEVVLRDKPTQLFVTKGQPQFEPLNGTDLLHVANSDQDILMEIKSQEIFIVASGRWYKSKKVTGPWTYVPSDALPKTFAQIGPDSPRAGVRPFVAGTPEAREAVLSASLPQTAAVKKGPVDIKVAYDGSPKWKEVEGMEKTDVAYAENAAEAVFKVKNRFYLCKEAVWYESAQPDGPWNVAVSIPSELNHLPPSCPHYQCSYVTIYESTPDVVYVGYTPGYMGCYVYGASIVFGTGYYYPPYYGYGGAYYPRPMTYGYHAYYNPYSGWGAVGYRGPNGGIAISGPVGGWGPGQPGRPGNGWGGPGGPGRPGNPGRPGQPGKPGSGVSTLPATGSNANIYNRSDRAGAKVQPTPQPSNRSGSNYGGTTSTGGGNSRPGANNMYADPSGNVYRQNKSGAWESPSGGGNWSKAQGGSFNSGQADLQRQSQVRNSSYSSNRGGYSSGGSRSGGYSGGGGYRGGGGRGGGGRR